MKKTILALLCLSLSIPCYARTITINADRSGEYPTIQAAIDAANDGDVIILTPGRYTGDGNRDIDYLGKAVTIRSTDPNDPNIVAETIIDCNSTFFERYRAFVFQSSEDADSALEGLYITNGAVDNGGGAISCINSSPTITNCTFVYNFAQVLGGAVSFVNSGSTVVNCSFFNNIAQQGAGALYSENSNLTLSGCKIISNTVWAMN